MPRPVVNGDHPYVFAFGTQTDGGAEMRELLGGKGANLAEMAKIGLPVPPGFTLGTEVCNYFYDHAGSYPDTLHDQVSAALKELEEQIGKRFGDPNNPLLISIRSGARQSMPGMMDTILNLGLNDETVEGLANVTGSRSFAFDCYRRFIHMYGDVVLGVHAGGESEEEPFDLIYRSEAARGDDIDFVELSDRYKKLILERTREPFPQNATDQLWGAIGAVFGSWRNDRAILYRQRYGIPASWGTAVNVQAMVFGNLGENSATGVAFTRDPATGENVLYGEYLLNAQGEDVVAGVRTPKNIAELVAEMPESFEELLRIRDELEQHFRDMQDFEFTIERGKFYLLQTRNGKRTGQAAVRIAVEMHQDGLMDDRTALLKVPAESIDSLLVPVFDPQALMANEAVAYGLPAGPGAASGKIVFSSDSACRAADRGEKVVLCRTETSPDDLKGMLVSEGILTARGGVSSHAALVARQLGKVCICGASDVTMNYEDRVLVVESSQGKQIVLQEGDDVSLDGSTGAIYVGSIKNIDSDVHQVLTGRLERNASQNFHLFETLMAWADRHRTLKIRTNADTPDMAEQATTLGAEGIGLCRTEHMFFAEDRIDHMRKMILAANEEQRREALAELLPFQRRDFYGLFRAMAGRPVTIRLLDPPLNEFLPQDEDIQIALAERLEMGVGFVVDRIEALHEQNPMLGCRGCRLGILYPEITEMQTTAIFEAVAEHGKDDDALTVRPEIMVPLVGFRSELADQVAIVRRVADEVMRSSGVEIEYEVGTMIEVPRAAITADEIALEAEFFSFGTNDLTQMALGLSRDDMGSFFDCYTSKEIYSGNPFSTIDEIGVGRLIEEAVQRGRATRADLKLGICGEHGGDPASIAFCHRVGLDYVSCSPFRVPVARLAAAQAALQEP
ncbi:MAG: pyruvate, phosphate dikinase [Pseudomonadota bacterium]|nr:pyruvate, phosphate dikinase [Pseudomonadota bacterium]